MTASGRRWRTSSIPSRAVPAETTEISGEESVSLIEKTMFGSSSITSNVDMRNPISKEGRIDQTQKHAISCGWMALPLEITSNALCRIWALQILAQQLVLHWFGT